MGIILIVLVSLGLFVSRLKSSEDTQQNLKQVTAVKTDMTIIKDYITQCLDSTTKDAIELVGAQGGFLYDYQLPGLYRYDNNMAEEILDIFFGKPVNITYAIMYRSQAQRNYPLIYPITMGEKYPYGEKLSSYPPFANILPLCVVNGSNSLNISSLVGSSKYSCETFGEDMSIQAMLQKYIQNKSYECLDFEYLINMTGYDIVHDEPNITLFFNQESVTSILDMKVVARSVDTNSQVIEDTKSVLTEFTVDIPVRLKLMHELAWHLLEREASDIFLNLNKKDISIPGCMAYSIYGNRDNFSDCIKDGMSIRLIKNSSGNYSLVVLLDEYSSVSSNDPFIFNILIQNRKPHIDKISYQRSFSSPYGEYLQREYSRNPLNLYSKSKYPLDPSYDIIVDYGEELIIVPYAIDPDEDNDPNNKTIMDGLYTYSSSPSLLTNSMEFYHYPGSSVQNKDYRVDVQNKSLVGTYYLTVQAIDSGNRYDDEIISIHIRCKDSIETDYPHSVDPSHWASINATQLDKNDTNDCCNEEGGFRWYTGGEECGLCKRCNSTGDCQLVVDSSTSFDHDLVSLQDCGPCNVCKRNPLNPSQAICEVKDSLNENQCPSGEHCCLGKCQAPKNLNDPDIIAGSCTRNPIIYKSLYPSCWDSEFVCAGGNPSDKDPDVISKSLNMNLYDCLKGHLVESFYKNGGSCDYGKII
jgi:hypothetical protein